jgi:hypothetical protein
MSIVPIGGKFGPAATRSPRGSAGVGFRVPQGEAEAVSRGAQAGAAGPVDLAAMLSLQDVDPPQERDRRARRQGEGLLAALARLQQALLSGAGEGGALAELALLSSQVEIAATPALREAVAAIRLRAAVELARADAEAVRGRPA